MKDQTPLLLGRFVACAIAGLAFTAAGSRYALSTSELTLEKGAALELGAVLVFLGLLVLALGHVRTARPLPRSLARATGVLVGLFSLGVYLLPGFAMFFARM